jgi:outer membrane biosynthesis protein TonB
MTRTSTQDLQEEFLTTLCKGQKTIIGALRIWVDTVTTVTPRLLPLTDKLPNVAVLFAGKLPTPEETVESAYGLAEQLLANQRKFADEVLALTVPLMSGRHTNGNTRTAPWPEPKVVQVTPEPKPAAVVLGPKPAAVVLGPKPAVAAEPKPAEPKPALAKAEPKPALAKSPAPKAAAPRTTAAKSAPRPAAKSAPRPAAKRTPKAAD